MKKNLYIGLVLVLIIYVFLFYLFKPVILRVLISIIFIIAALLSPPDPLSQIFIALPLILLYELSIIISKIFYNEEK